MIIKVMLIIMTIILIIRIWKKESWEHRIKTEKGMRESIMESQWNDYAMIRNKGKIARPPSLTPHPPPSTRGKNNSCISPYIWT